MSAQASPPSPKADSPQAPSPDPKSGRRRALDWFATALAAFALGVATDVFSNQFGTAPWLLPVVLGASILIAASRARRFPARAPLVRFAFAAFILVAIAATIAALAVPPDLRAAFTIVSACAVVASMLVTSPGAQAAATIAWTGTIGYGIAVLYSGIESYLLNEQLSGLSIAVLGAGLALTGVSLLLADSLLRRVGWGLVTASTLNVCIVAADQGRFLDSSAAAAIVTFGLWVTGGNDQAVRGFGLALGLMGLGIIIGGREGDPDFVVFAVLFGIACLAGAVYFLVDHGEVISAMVAIIALVGSDIAASVAQLVKGQWLAGVAILAVPIAVIAFIWIQLDGRELAKNLWARLTEPRDSPPANADD